MKALVETSQLKKSFVTKAGELQVLKGIDLSINEGEMVSIVGASGVGNRAAASGLTVSWAGRT